MNRIKQVLLLLSLWMMACSTFADNYPVNFDKETKNTHKDRILKSISFNGKSIVISSSMDDRRMYYDLTAQVFQAIAGQEVSVKFNFSPGWMNGYVYIDQGNDGNFSANVTSNHLIQEGSDLMSFSNYNGYNSLGKKNATTNTIVMPSFTIPVSLAPGDYRMRFKVDWSSIDPGGRVDASNSIINNGGTIVDVTLRILPAQVTVSDHSTGGRILDGGGTTLQDRYPRYQAVTVKADPDAGYLCKEIRMYAATDSNTPLAVFDWHVIGTDGTLTIPAQLVKDDLVLSGTFVKENEEDAEDPYQLVFVDEFNLPDGSQPNPSYWARSKRTSAVWSRYISDSKDVVFIKDHQLVLRAIPNPDRSKDQVPMLTGSVDTWNHYDFTYGLVEVRMKTTHHEGNFPAAWMMPIINKEWPYHGEIDIFETIDNQDIAYHTVHSQWTDVKPYHRSQPINGFHEYQRVEDWHVYGLQWTADSIIWYVDGIRTGSYARSTDATAIAGGQWPYTTPFFLRLNQSVGAGTWAAQADTTFTYESRVDWVKVYQLKTPSSISAVTTPPRDTSANAPYYDLLGRRVEHPSHGIYIHHRKKVMVK